MSWDEIKKMDVAEILEMLQIKVKDNSERIKRNNEMIRELLINESVSKERSMALNVLNTDNKKIMKLNNVYLELHIKLLSFIKSLREENHFILFKNSYPQGNTSVITEKSEEDIFNDTISGTIIYNENHPFYNQKSFKERLFLYYEKNEEYEKCAELIKDLKD